MPLYNQLKYGDRTYGSGPLDVSFFIDVNLDKIFDSTFTLDSNLIKTQVSDFSLDAYLLDVTAYNFDLDANLLKNYSSTFTLDAVLLKENSFIFSLDLNLLKNIVGSFSLDSNLLKSLNSTFILDSSLLQENSFSFSIDSNLFKQGITHNLNLNTNLLKHWTTEGKYGQIKYGERTYGITHPPLCFIVYGDLLKNFISTFTLDSRINRHHNATFTLDASLRAIYVRPKILAVIKLKPNISIKISPGIPNYSSNNLVPSIVTIKK